MYGLDVSVFSLYEYICCSLLLSEEIPVLCLFKVRRDPAVVHTNSPVLGHCPASFGNIGVKKTKKE